MLSLWVSGLALAYLLGLANGLVVTAPAAVAGKSYLSPADCNLPNITYEGTTFRRESRAPCAQAPFFRRVVVGETLPVVPARQFAKV